MPRMPKEIITDLLHFSLATTPKEFQPILKDLIKSKTRLVEINMPDMLWYVLKSGLEGNKEKVSVDQFINNQLISSVFLPSSQKQCEDLIHCFKTVIISISVQQQLKEEKARKEKGYE